MINLLEFQKEQMKWRQKNFGDTYGSGYRPLLGIVEEVGELSHAHLKKEQGIRTNENHDTEIQRRFRTHKVYCDT